MDSERVRTEFLDDIYFSLEWLDISPDEGPGSVQEFSELFSQKLRKPKYVELVEKIEQLGATFNCQCSRSQIASRSPDNLYDGHCKNLSLPFRPGMSKRFSMNASPGLSWDKEIPFPMIQKRNGDPSFHIASISDDHDFEVDLIVRGEDLKASSEFQNQLNHALFDPAYNTYSIHHPVLVDKKGKKISKSTLSNPWVKANSDKRKLFGILGEILGLRTSVPTHLEGFLDYFDGKKISESKRQINFE